MRYAYFLFSFLSITIAVSSCQLSNWKSYAIDEQVSVQLPAAPEAVDVAKLFASEGKAIPEDKQWAVQEQAVKVLVASDDIATYQIMRTAHVEIPLTEKAPRTTFYDEMIDGILRPQAGIVLERTGFSTAGGEGVEVRFRGVHQDTGKKAVKYMRLLLVGEVGYLFNFIPNDLQDTAGVATSKQRLRFFQSLVVKNSRVQPI